MAWLTVPPPGRAGTPGVADRSAFLADLYDCLLDLALPEAQALTLVVDTIEPREPGGSGRGAAAATVPRLVGSAFGLSTAPPSEAISWIVGDAARLPLRSRALGAVLLYCDSCARPAVRPALDEVRRVLRRDGALLVASPEPCRDPRRRRAGQAVGWCRLLEEHGFTVEKTLATRAAPATTDRTTAARYGAPAPRLMLAPSFTRDRALGGHEWESLIVQARSCL